MRSVPGIVFCRFADDAIHRKAVSLAAIRAKHRQVCLSALRTGFRLALFGMRAAIVTQVGVALVSMFGCVLLLLDGLACLAVQRESIRATAILAKFCQVSFATARA